MKISIIIPVYNSEKYLSDAVDSCIAQTLKEIEIIMIDDASTDNSREIMRKYASEHDNVKLFFQKENRRQGAARNIGIKNACGEYLLFLDSDDWLSPDACEKLWNKAHETNSDMVAGNYQYVYPDKTETICVYDDTVLGELDYIKKKKLISMRGLHICRIYKRSFIIENEIYYPENVFFEDSLFNSIAIMYAESLSKVDTVFYYYRMNEMSTVHINIEHHYYMADIAKYLIEFAKNRGILDRYYEIVYTKVAVNYYNALSAAMSVGDKKAIALMYKIKKEFNEIRRDKKFKNIPVNRLLIINSISPQILMAYCCISRLKNRRVNVWKIINDYTILI